LARKKEKKREREKERDRKKEKERKERKEERRKTGWTISHRITFCLVDNHKKPIHYVNL